MTSPARGTWIALAKIVLAAGLLAGMFHFGAIDFGLLASGVHAPGVIAGAFILVATIPFIAALRWKFLLHGQGLHLPYLRLARINLIGTFFSMFLLGGISGDAARLIYIVRETKGPKSALALSLVADRYLGFLGVATLAAAALAFSSNALSAEFHEIPVVAGIVGLFAGALSILIAGVWGVSRLTASAFYSRLTARSAFATRLSGILNAVSEYRHQPRLLAYGWPLSVTIHVVTVAAIVLIAGALQIGDLGVTHYGVITPLTFLANSLPITPGGFGVGEAVFHNLAQIFTQNPAAPYATVFLAFRVLWVSVAVLSAPVYVMYKRADGPGAAAGGGQ